MMWISRLKSWQKMTYSTSQLVWSLNATIADLSVRKQSYKKQSMYPLLPSRHLAEASRTVFVRLHRILICAVVVIAAFFGRLFSAIPCVLSYIC